MDVLLVISILGTNTFQQNELIIIIIIKTNSFAARYVLIFMNEEFVKKYLQNPKYKEGL